MSIHEIIEDVRTKCLKLSLNTNQDLKPLPETISILTRRKHYVNDEMLVEWFNEEFEKIEAIFGHIIKADITSDQFLTSQREREILIIRIYALMDILEAIIKVRNFDDQEIDEIVNSLNNFANKIVISVKIIEDQLNFFRSIKDKPYLLY